MTHHPCNPRELLAKAKNEEKPQNDPVAELAVGGTDSDTRTHRHTHTDRQAHTRTHTYGRTRTHIHTLAQPPTHKRARAHTQTYTHSKNTGREGPERTPQGGAGGPGLGGFSILLSNKLIITS